MGCRGRAFESRHSDQKPSEISRFQRVLVRVARLERAASTSQMSRATNCTTPGYLTVVIIARNSCDSKFFLSVVIYVVKAVFWPGFAAWKNPANARVARGSGLWLYPSWMKSTTLPKQARYQLRYTRLLSCFIRLGVFSQMSRATNCATPGYSVCLSGWAYSPKPPPLPIALIPDICVSSL